MCPMLSDEPTSHQKDMDDGWVADRLGYTVQEGGCRFMAAWVREEENASNQRQKKREAEEADKVEVAPGVTVASLRRFRTALIGPTQGLPKRRRLCR